MTEVTGSPMHSGKVIDHVLALYPYSYITGMDE